MAGTTVKNEQQKNGIFSNMANPVMRTLEKNGEYAAQNTASYRGIVTKTVYFLLVTVAGVLLCFILHNILTGAAGANVYHFEDTERGIFDITLTVGEGVIMGIVVLVSIITPFIAWFVRTAVPVAGTLYCVAQGMLIGFITVCLAPDYKFISLLAMIITLSLVGAMLFVYAKRIITVTARFRGVITAVFAGIVLSGIIYFILTLIPAVRNSGLFSGINTALNNPVVSVVIGIVFVILASLFMLVDFDTIERCVENKMDKKYEWMASWGLAYTILYIYFKVLRILLIIFGNRSGSKR